MTHNRKDYQERIQDSANKIPADEPVFLLRAQDELAAETVQFYIKRSQAKLKEAKQQGASKEDIAKRQKAIDLLKAHAYAMADWPVKKTADVG